MMRWWLRQTVRLVLLLVILIISAIRCGEWLSSDVFIYSARVNHGGVTSEIRLHDKRSGLAYAIIYGHQITQVSLTADGQSVIFGQFAGIGRHEIATHRVHQSYLIRPDDNAMPLVAPNGTWIAYQSLNTSMLNAPDTLLVIDNAGYTHHNLQTRSSAWAWFPDSSHLTFAVQDGDVTHLKSLDIETGVVTSFADAPYTVHDMDWSPDETMLLLSDSSRLYRYDVATSDTTTLYTSSSDLLLAPQWSNDGQRILWLSDNHAGEYRLTLATAQGIIIESFVLGDITNLNRVDWWQTASAEN
jgi:hypothetical protein